MSSRKYPSGAEKRKLKQHMENEAKNHPTIFKFFKPDNDANSSFDYNILIENFKTESQVDNLDENALNNHETELKLAVISSVSIKSVLVSTSNKIEISKDPGLWPETINTYFREECIKLGYIFFKIEIKNIRIQNVYLILKIVFCLTVYLIEKCIMVI